MSPEPPRDAGRSAGPDQRDEVDLSALLLPDLLAADRTALSNERTLLAYVRTALTFGVAGATLIRFFDGGALTQGTGLALVVTGVALGLFGVVRFAAIRARIQAYSTPVRRLREEDEEEED